MLRIVTDSASDITLEQAEKMNIDIVPIHISFPDGPCLQEKEEDFADFYQRLVKAEDLPATSQPSPEEYLKIFNEAKKAKDEVLVLTLSSGLSGTINAAKIAAEMCDYNPVYIIDSRQAIAGQRILTEYAVSLREKGLPIEKIIDRIENLRDRIMISGLIDTLTYLKKGGRIPASFAALGNALKIKPVIALEDTILKNIGKALGHEAGIKHLYSRLEKYPPDPDFPLYFLYSSNREMGEKFMEKTLFKYDFQNYPVSMLPVGGVIGTHVGTNCIGICYVAKELPEK